MLNRKPSSEFNDDPVHIPDEANSGARQKASVAKRHGEVFMESPSINESADRFWRIFE
ncbi:MAG: hypothetical protein JWQ42_3170 [Edaphobacter sp.]|nr:hypothetical protein [Edaphobacter sp.]